MILIKLGYVDIAFCNSISCPLKDKVHKLQLAGQGGIDANGDKDAYKRCKDKNPCVGYLREELFVLDSTAACKISFV